MDHQGPWLALAVRWPLVGTVIPQKVRRPSNFKTQSKFIAIVDHASPWSKTNKYQFTESFELLVPSIWPGWLEPFSCVCIVLRVYSAVLVKADGA